MGVHKTSFESNPHVGLFGFATDKYCLLGQNVSDKELEHVKSALEVPVLQCSIAGTPLLGVFAVGNEKHIVVPSIIFDEELNELKVFAASIGVDVTVVDSPITCLGNAVLCNDEGAYVSDEFSAFAKKRLREALGVKVVPGTIAQNDTVGALGVVVDGHAFLDDQITDDERARFEDAFGFEPEEGQLGQSGYIKSNVICNKKGFVIGNACKGDEIMQFEEGIYHD